MAGSTGLEPAASGVTGRRSNQLNYDPAKLFSCRPPTRWVDVHAMVDTVSDPARVLALGNPPLISEPRVGGTGLEPVTAGV